MDEYNSTRVADALEDIARSLDLLANSNKPNKEVTKDMVIPVLEALGLTHTSMVKLRD